MFHYSRYSLAAAFLVFGSVSLAATFTKGNIFASVGNGKVKEFTPAGVLVQTLDTTTGSSFTTGSAFDSGGNFFVTSFGASKVSKFDLNGNLVNANFVTGNTDNETIAFDAMGNFYLGQADGLRKLYKYDSSGTLLNTWSPTVGPRGTDWIDLAADQKTIYYTSEGGSIRRFDTSTGTPLPDLTSTLGGSSFALRILGDGSVLVAHTNNVLRVSSTGTVLQTYTDFGGNPVSTLFSLNLDPDGTTFWTGDLGTGRIYRINIASGALVSNFLSAPFTVLGGLSVFGELTQGSNGGSALDGSFQIRYAANLTAGDSVINITNTGANGAALAGPGFGGATGNVCVNVYAFSPDEQLISCCSCLITPNGLVSLSVNQDLVNNTLTGVRPNSVVVKLLNTLAGATGTGATCTNSAALAGSTDFPVNRGIVALGTTIHAGAAGGSFSVTETPFLNATLSPAERASITNRCANIIGNGSSFGICRSCRTGGLSASGK